MKYRYQIEIFALYGITFVSFFVISRGLASPVNVGLVYLIPGVTLESGGPIIGGLTEPFTTKLLPTMLVVYVIRNISDTDPSLKLHALPLTLLAGISVAWGEAILVKLPQYPPSDDITILIAAVIGTTVLHTIGAVLVTGTYLLSAETPVPRKQDILRTVPWLFMAMGFHAIWNGYFSNQEWFLPFWYDVLRLLF